MIGALSLRVSGLYFAITSFIFTLIVNVVVSDETVTGGYAGMSGPLFPSFPRSVSVLGTSLVWAIGVGLLAAIVVVWSIRGSAAYPGLLAIRDAEPFAASAGIRTQVTRVAMFSLSAAIAGLAGWTFSFLGFITPGQFNGTTSINILVMVILGGMNTRFGPIVGATFVSLFPVLVSWDPLLQEILFGAIFILVIVFLPEGFVGLVGRVARALRRRPAAAPALVPMEEVARDLAPLADQPDPGGVALEALGVGFSYVKGTPVLSDVNFTVRHGTIHGLIGPNGSGKSTLVNLLSGALRPTAGTIALHGNRVERLGASRRPGLGLMRTFQTPTMAREVTTTANVTTGLLHRYRWVATRSMIWPFLPSGRRISRELDSAAVVSLQRVGAGARVGPREGRRRPPRRRAAHPAGRGQRRRALDPDPRRAPGRPLLGRGRARRHDPGAPPVVGGDGDPGRAPDPVRIRRLRRGHRAGRGRARGDRRGRRRAPRRAGARGVPGAMTDALAIQSLSGGYGRFDAIHDVALRVAPGESVALLGPNGAGKTTVLKAVMGLLAHRRGSICVNGVEVGSMSAHRVARGHAALVPEGRRLFAGLSVEDNLRLGAMRHRRDPARVEALLASVFRLFPVVEAYRRRPATSLSGGEQQMVAIGRMMMNDPAVMLLDEPSLGLAPLAVADMARALAALRDEGRSLLLVEQRVDVALQVCSRVYVLADGRIVDHQATADLDDGGRALIDSYLG